MKKRTALVVATLLLLALGAGCPGKGEPPLEPKGAGTPPPPPAPPQVPGDTAATASPGVTKPVLSWSDEAELVAKKLDELVSSVEKGDKTAALKLHESAYFECYENEAWNVEVASQRFLPVEKLDGKDRNVAIVREDLFAQIKTAVKAGAPATKVRALVDELTGKIRADAKKLDEMKITPDQLKPR